MVETPHETFCFGEYTLDVTSHRLLHGRTEIMLKPRPFSALLHLVKNPDKLISKDQLIEAVLGMGVNVTDDAPKKWIENIRSELPKADQRIIETVHGQGYRFSLPVRVNV